MHISVVPPLILFNIACFFFFFLGWLDGLMPGSSVLTKL